ncbi:hypothetical protein DPMN_167123 [Dreissena polymorpha]|uniref:Uncharacterized protein n=1 Tax=Dreissena polymorpha TaxID=45954 RepID=A0A9D4F3V5_DREPO|nr:hypothetical protein DPMN_167123 [Dreissena polymorpha]
MVGVIYMAIGLLGKLSALFIMIPEPVLGGALLSITAVFIGRSDGKEGISAFYAFSPVIPDCC